ncbi:MAG: VWA domain-containing protein [Sedimentisphaerales bacterium]|nr:VWA domain-containing protein [Sedimentisphaerales bacterium]
MRRRWRHDRTVTLLAWLSSILIHVVVFSVFGAVSFRSAGQGDAGRTRPVPVVAQIKQAMNTPFVIPKPKVKTLFSEHRSLRPVKKDLEWNTVGKIDLGQTQEPVVELFSETPLGLETTDRSATEGVSFFGQYAGSRKICYVVDASGSMHGRLGQVKTQLTDSIEQLRPDQFFYIIFFQDGDRLLETGGGRLVRATPANKEQARAFIDGVIPSGPTNAVNALQRAMQIRDSQGRTAELIYFLTDGFDLGEGTGVEMFAAQIENVRKDLASGTRINTIGFWVEPEDVAILRHIARQSGGAFTNIE